MQGERQVSDVARPRRPKITPEDVALRVAGLLPDPSALIGGLAVTAHGYVRATDDVDFVCPADPKEIQARLGEAGMATSVRRGDILEGDIRSCVFGMLDGIRVDVLFPPVPITWDKTVLLPLTKGSRLRVVDLDTLIRLKLRAGGPQDLLDVVHLLRRHPEMVVKAKELAAAYGLSDRLELWLADPKIRAPESVEATSTSRRSARRKARR